MRASFQPCLHRRRSARLPSSRVLRAAIPPRAMRPPHQRVDEFPKGEPTSSFGRSRCRTPVWVQGHEGRLVKGCTGATKCPLLDGVHEEHESSSGRDATAKALPTRKPAAVGLPRGGPRGTGRSPWQGGRGTTTHTLCSLRSHGLLIPVYGATGKGSIDAGKRSPAMS